MTELVLDRDLGVKQAIETFLTARDELAAPREDEGCVLFATGLSLETASLLHSALRPGSLELVLSTDSFDDVRRLLRDSLSTAVESLTFSLSGAWGTLGLLPATPQASATDSMQWLLEVRRNKKAPNSSRQFEAAVRDLESSLAGGRPPAATIRWKQRNRQEAIADLKASVAQVREALVGSSNLGAQGRVEIVARLRASFANLRAICEQRIGGEQGAQALGARIQFEVRGDYRPESFNIDPREIYDAISTLDRVRPCGAILSFWGLRWKPRYSSSDESSMGNAIDLFTTERGWSVRLRSVATLFQDEMKRALRQIAQT